MAGERFFFNTSIYSHALGSTDYVQSADIVTSANASLANVAGFNPTATAGYLLLFAKHVAGLAANDVPKLSFQVPAGASFAYASVLAGLEFDTGCCFAVSTTGHLYTPSTDKWFVLAEGRTL